MLVRNSNFMRTHFNPAAERHKEALEDDDVNREWIKMQQKMYSRQELADRNLNTSSHKKRSQYHLRPGRSSP